MKEELIDWRGGGHFRGGSGDHRANRWGCDEAEGRKRRKGPEGRVEYAGGGVGDHGEGIRGLRHGTLPGWLGWEGGFLEL